MKLGEILKDLRTNKSELTLEKLAYEYDILWKISEAIGIKCSDIIKMLEDKLGDDFTLIDE